MSDFKEISNFDILNILGKKNISINGIFSKDLLPKLKKGFYIINLEKSDQGNGTHWTTLYYDDDNNFYMDSFGSPAPIEIQKHLKDYFYNDKQIQNINSEACGYYCICFIEYFTKNKINKDEFQKFLNIFKTNSKHNYLILKNLIFNKSTKNI